MPYRSLSLTVACCLLLLLQVFSQRRPSSLTRLRAGAVLLPKNIDTLSVAHFAENRLQVRGQSFHLVRFDHIPTAAEKRELSLAGVLLLEYIPDNTYVVRITDPGAVGILKSMGAESIVGLRPEDKLAPGMSEGGVALELQVALFPTLTIDTLIGLLAEKGYIITGSRYRNYHIISLRCRQDQLQTLAALPFVRYIEKVAPPAAPLTGPSDKPSEGTKMPFSRDNERANLLQPGLPGGYDLTGKGVKIGVWEFYGPPPPHIDFADRIDYLVGGTAGLDPLHGTLVTGLIGGAGIVDELYTGYAPQATLYSAGMAYTPVPPGVVLTSNAYPSGAGPCESGGGVDLALLTADQQTIDLPSLQNVFSAGNSGNRSCSLYPFGYHTILGGAQSAKNPLSVGNVASDGQLDYFSSRGPTGDGRIKPEIVATGDNVVSPAPGNTYAAASGTSFSGPAVVGGLALLYEEYRKRHNGTDPTAQLMKGILCNTATDLGNPGPDFNFGFGWMNLLRAIRVLDSTHYFQGIVSGQSADHYTIAVPAGTAQLKVMLCWQDPPSSLYAFSLLVNDLDLQVKGPDGTTTLPYILDTTAAHLNDNAVRGEDHANNTEQVVITHPAAGTYTLQVKPYIISMGDQQSYDLIYDIVPNGVELTYPAGGSRLAPGETATVQWDSWGDTASTYDLFLSPDGGTSWQTIAGNFTAAARQYSWTVPSIATANARIKLVRNADGATSTSQSFIIVGSPAIALAAHQCPGAISLSWAPVDGATDYEVMKLCKGVMTRVDTTTNTHYYLRDLAIDSTWWVTVRSRIHGVPGRRAQAISRMPADGDCADTGFDGDLAADSLLAPVTGRKFTASALGAHDTVRLRVRNHSAQAISGYILRYQVNGGAWASDTVMDALPAGGMIVHSFHDAVDVSAPGTYAITALVSASGDPDPRNDTFRVRVRQLDNQPLGVTASLVDDFSQTMDSSYFSGVTGIGGAERWDYMPAAAAAGASLTIRAANAAGDSAVTLSYAPYSPGPGPYSYLTATYNLSLFDSATGNAGLSFAFHTSNKTLPAGILSIRGGDDQPWINIPDLSPYVSGNGSLLHLSVPDLSWWLRKAGQNFSSSFQARWALQDAYVNYYFDSIRIFSNTPDAELRHIDSLAVNNFGLSSRTPIHITVRNNGAGAVMRLPVYYRVDSGGLVTDTVSFLAAGDSTAFTFSVPADLSLSGLHIIRAGTQLKNDLYRDNDEKQLSIHNQPLIRQFPYLENFEQGDGSWYEQPLNGNGSLWGYGSPAGRVIHSAASGTKAWKTNLTGEINRTFIADCIYSPFFDLSGLVHPAVSFSVSLHTDSCGTPCSYLAWQYSADSGRTWVYLTASPNGGIIRLSSPTYSRWHVASNALPAVPGIVQFRALFHSGYFDNYHYEGIAVDDIHIYDSVHAIYDPGSSGTLSLQQAVPAGDQWVNFVQDGQVVAAILPGDQDLGLTSLQTFLHEGGERNFHGQYYLDRNWVIRPGNTQLSHPVKVRLYFTDKESEALLFADSCAVCTKPPDAYRLGISVHSSDKASTENDSLEDDQAGGWSYLDHNKVAIVPFEKGYYAELAIDDLRFSEFRLNNGGYEGESPLPVDMLNLSVLNVPPREADLRWSTASEIDIDHFEVERAEGNDAYSQGNFVRRGTVRSKGAAMGQQDYLFADRDSSFNGAYYYRIKAVDSYGQYAYSDVLPALFANGASWQLYPNPSRGLFTLSGQADAAQTVEYGVYNVLGICVGRGRSRGTGFLQTITIDLSGGKYPAGVYSVKLFTPSTQVLKGVKAGK